MEGPTEQLMTAIPHNFQIFCYIELDITENLNSIMGSLFLQEPVRSDVILA